MRKIFNFVLVNFILCSLVCAQTLIPEKPQTTQQTNKDDDIIRISTTLIQTNVAVTDDNDNPVTDLKLEDFEVYDNGKKQELKFLEFISVGEPTRREGLKIEDTKTGEPINVDTVKSLSAAEVKRVVAFVIDDLTLRPEDIPDIRQALMDFVDNKMQSGDLVGIIRSYRGSGLFQQLTANKELLKKAISQLSYQYTLTDDIFIKGESIAPPSEVRVETQQPIADETDLRKQTLKVAIALQTTGSVVDSLKQIPGRKSVVLISRGLRSTTSTKKESLLAPEGTLIAPGVPTPAQEQYAVIEQFQKMFRELTDNAVRAGVTINTMNPAGPESPFTKMSELTTKSGMDAATVGFGRGSARDMEQINNNFGSSDQLGLNALAKDTGGVSISNLNDLNKGLDKIMSRNKSYYILAYAPSEEFDNKFHKLQIKVKRKDVKIYQHSGYIAKPDSPASAPKTKEEEILAAIRSPLMKRDLEVSASVYKRYAPNNKIALTIDLLIDVKAVNFTKGDDGKYKSTFDFAGFLYDETGKSRGGFSETVNLNLTEENYQRALKEGVSYSANTELPGGTYQLRGVVREGGSGQIGTVTEFLDLPSLSSANFTASSLFLHAVDFSNPNATPEALNGSRRISQKRDLRYAVFIYNQKNQNGSQVTSRVIISQGGKIIFQEPETKVETMASGQLYKLGQMGISKLRPGRYVLTVILNDTLNKKARPVSRSIDFFVTN